MSHPLRTSARHHRLPDGGSTTDYDHYLSKWHDMADRVVRFFPGFHLGGMDPGLILFSDDYKGDSISLSVKACMALLTKEVI
jgi:hypothetical protein